MTLSSLPSVVQPVRPRRSRLWRLKRGLTQAELAARTGISKSSIERIETNVDGTVNLRHLVNIALALDCELLDVVDDDWLRYHVLDVRVPRPSRKRLGREPGAAPPPPQRERAWRRT